MFNFSWSGRESGEGVVLLGGVPTTSCSEELFLVIFQLVGVCSPCGREVEEGRIGGGRGGGGGAGQRKRMQCACVNIYLSIGGTQPVNHRIT